jgi:DDE superfamily endonuclease
LVFLDAHRPGRKVKVTDSRAAVDFAACMRELTDIHFPNSERIRVVLDNLSTHSASDAILGLPRRRSPTRAAPTRVPLCPYYTRLNLVEIEIGVLRRQYLQRRIATKQQLVSQIAARQHRRNASGARIKWMFTTEKARAKIDRAYLVVNLNH